MACEASPQWRCPAEVLQLIIVNLIRNAMQHGCGPDIDIKLQAVSLTISNRFEVGENKDGFGVGLSLLRRLCGRFDLGIAYRPQLAVSGAEKNDDSELKVIISVINPCTEF